MVKPHWNDWPRKFLGFLPLKFALPKSCVSFWCVCFRLFGLNQFRSVFWGIYEVWEREAQELHKIPCVCELWNTAQLAEKLGNRCSSATGSEPKICPQTRYQNLQKFRESGSHNFHSPIVVWFYWCLGRDSGSFFKNLVLSKGALERPSYIDKTVAFANRRNRCHFLSWEKCLKHWFLGCSLGWVF